MPGPADNIAVIEARDLVKIFGRFTAVDKVSFTVNKGEIFGLLGPNGAGKSTTIRMLCGLLSSTAGSASVGGFDINTHPGKVRQNIGYMSQKFSLYKDLSVMENMLFFGGIYGLERPALTARAESVLKETGLGELRTSLTGAISGAYQQRLSLACAIIHQPPILFLDEPTSGVDPISRRNFWDLIRRMTDRGVTVLVTTHFMDEAEFCARIGFISAGRLIALGSPAEIKARAVTDDLFEAGTLDLTSAKEKAASLEGVIDVSYYGPKMHIFCRRGLYNGTSLTAALEKHGLKTDFVNAVKPSLEDAFVRLAKQTAGGTR